MNDESLVRTGRTWVFGDNINTDLIMPNTAFSVPYAEHHRLVFSANRPGWGDEVQEGDIVVAGRNFGLGSGRPIGRLLGENGVRGMLVETVNCVALRNCVNYGMPLLECAGVTTFFNEGDVAEVQYRKGIIRNLTAGTELQTKPLPELLASIVVSGGVFPMLIREGLIEPQPTIASAV